MLLYTTHLLLDAARMEAGIDIAKQRNSRHESLYATTPDAHLSGVSPYLFQFHIGTPFGHWYAHSGWGQAWGVALKSSLPMPELARHLRKFLKVQTETGQTFRFRFYDPRVLRVFLPTCDDAQIREFFGKAVDYFIVEDEDPAFALKFYQQNGVLQTERFSVKEEIEALPQPEPLPAPEEEPLPPETIAMLKEQGVELPQENVVVAAPPPAITKDPAPLPDKADERPAQEGIPKVKKKWNTFD